MDEIEVNRSAIKRGEQIKYLGINLTNNTSVAGDVDRCCDFFLLQFNGMYHKFKFLHMNILQFLFISYCMSLYGIEMCYDKLECQQQLEIMSVTYHKAIKKMYGMKFWIYNHVACDNFELRYLQAHLAKRCYKFYCSIVTSKISCFSDLQYYYKVEALSLAHVKSVFWIIYNVNDFLRNDPDAHFSRISFVPRTEPGSNHVFMKT